VQGRERRCRPDKTIQWVSISQEVRSRQGQGEGNRAPTFFDLRAGAEAGGNKDAVTTIWSMGRGGQRSVKKVGETMQEGGDLEGGKEGGGRKVQEGGGCNTA